MRPCCSVWSPGAIRFDFDRVIPVSTAGALKPHPAVYRAAARELIMVSANSFDVLAAELCAPVGHPIAVGVARGPSVDRVVAPVEHGVAVVARARLDAAVGAGQMQLAGQPAGVAVVSQQAWLPARPRPSGGSTR